jgi:amidophosphoribosyltransferase
MCGIVGLIGLPDAPRWLLRGLEALQHRGADAAGMAVPTGNSIERQIVAGPVRALTIQAPAPSATAAVGHVRYPTNGIPGNEGAQPLIHDGRIWAHNGQVVNTDALLGPGADETLRALDSLVLVSVISKLLMTETNRDDLVAALRSWSQVARGAWSVTAWMLLGGKPALIAWRDAQGFRPAVYARCGAGWAVASESIALEAMGCEPAIEVPAGSVVVLREHHAPELLQVVEPRPHRCALESIYFAHRTSRWGAQPTFEFRRALGRALAADLPSVPFDAVVAVPHTAGDAAEALAAALGVPLHGGFDASSLERSFIQSDPGQRSRVVRKKLVPRREVFAGQRILLVDDSVVRGSTLDDVLPRIQALRPAAIHVAVAAPPLRHPCYFGIDLPFPEDLLAAQWGSDHLERGLAERWGVHTVTYLPLEKLREIADSPMCYACFDGAMPIPVLAPETAALRRRAAGRKMERP